MKTSISRDQSRGPHLQKHELPMTEGRLGTPKVMRDPMEMQVSYEGQGVSNRAGKSILMAQVESSVSACISGQDQDDAPRKCTSGSLPATGKDDQKAEWKEAASAQAVKRGHQVSMIEVPDDEDDTSFRKWVAKGSPMISPTRKTVELPTPPNSPTIPTKTPYWDSRCTDFVSPKGPPTSPLPDKGVGPTYEVTSPTVAMSSATSAKVKEAPHRWMRPFEVDWMLRAVCEA